MRVLARFVRRVVGGMGPVPFGKQAWIATGHTLVGLVVGIHVQRFGCNPFQIVEAGWGRATWETKPQNVSGKSSFLLKQGPRNENPPGVGVELDGWPPLFSMRCGGKFALVMQPLLDTWPCLLCAAQIHRLHPCFMYT